MKIILLTLLFGAGLTTVRAQFNKELQRFYNIQDSAAYYEAVGKDGEALKCYQQLLAFSKLDVSYAINEKMARLYLRQHKPKLAKHYLTTFILSAGPVEKDWFDRQYQGKLSLNIDSLNDLFRLNYSLYSEIHKNLYQDQTLRRIDIALRMDTTVNKDWRMQLFKRFDSLYCEEIKAIVVSLGHIPTLREVGWQMQQRFIMVITTHHMYKDTAFWYPYYLKGTDNGTVPRISMPFLIDIEREKNGEKSLYCTNFNFMEPARMMEPLYPDKVDELRARFYLPPLYMQAIIDSTMVPEGYVRR